MYDNFTPLIRAPRGYMYEKLPPSADAEISLIVYANRRARAVLRFDRLGIIRLLPARPTYISKKLIVPMECFRRCASIHVGLHLGHRLDFEVRESCGAFNHADPHSISNFFDALLYPLPAHCHLLRGRGPEILQVPSHLCARLAVEILVPPGRSAYGRRLTRMFLFGPVIYMYEG